MRSEDGVHRVEKLVRNKPFAEWVTVYFDPKRLTEAHLLKLLRERRCPRAAQVRSEGKPLTVMNPFVAPGGIVQIRISSKAPLTLTPTELPPGWKLIGEQSALTNLTGQSFLSLQVPRNAKAARHTIRFQTADGAKLEAATEVVRKVGA